ncbi:MAG: LacI family DNA-binding transcriptional regulator [Planctomycetes bacterium]|nr:LacI family DNA-binding transcriptional regulator [Planctomycetota bacterium]
MNKKSPMTQTEIARQLGLSQKTVSQAFCGTGRLSQETRDRILSHASKVGYRPNFSAQSIRNGRQNRLGIFMGLEGHRGPLPIRRLHGMQLAAFEEKVSLAICTFPDRIKDKKPDLGRLLGGFGVDAMLVNYATDISEEMNNMLAHFRMPTITINSKFDYDCIHPDDEGISYATGKAIIDKGKRPVMYVTYGPRSAPELPGGLMPVHYSEIDREKGIRRGVESAGEDIMVIDLPGFADAGTKWIAEMSKEGRPAVVCYNEVVAQRVYVEACREGLLCPDDFDIMYYARQPFYDDKMDSTLQAVMIPEFEIGYRAVHMLLERQRSGKPLPTEAIGAKKVSMWPSCLEIETSKKETDHET